MRLEEERENRKLEREHEMKLKQMEIEESRRRDEQTCRLREHELEVTMQINESRTLDSTLTARTKRFIEFRSLYFSCDLLIVLLPFSLLPI